MVGELEGKKHDARWPRLRLGCRHQTRTEGGPKLCPIADYYATSCCLNWNLTKSWFFSGHDRTHPEVRKTSTIEVCPRCATPSRVIYEHRVARIRNAPIR